MALTISTFADAKYALDITETMIDRLSRELYSNGSMMGAVNSAYEAMTQTEKENYEIKRKQLNYLLTYRTGLLDYTITEMSGGTGALPTLTKESGFDFSI